MHLFDKLRASLRRKPNKIELTLSQQIENLLNQSNVSQGDHRLLLLRLVYEHRSRQFDALNVPSYDSKRLEFERSMLKSLLAITSSITVEKSQSNFQRSCRLYRSMPMATSALPIIIVEFGQQRQRLKLNKSYLTLNELLQLFSQTFQNSFDLIKYEILLFNKPLHSLTKIDFTKLDNYQRFKIQLNRELTRSMMVGNTDEMTSLKQRLDTAALGITEVAVIIRSIQTNYKHLIKTLTNEDDNSIYAHTSSDELSNLLLNENTVCKYNQDLNVPPGFKPLSMHQKRLNTSPQDSQSTDEGIDRDAGSVSVFESAHSGYESDSVYLECREDVTIINEPNSKIIGGNNQLEWRDQPYRPRPYWNNNQVKSQSNSNKDQFGNKPRLKKPVNPNKPPLAAEKKKNIPCKYAAGGNCKRGSQCRFIHVV